ncbi:hypothetical protein RND81_10G071300 [Saponaria officinalis]|uniref:Uncharacterized protein n=1 Tax=Saponaria officinalis TaxID=3572 RepID=A0AAW1HZY8_SAPOF
MVFKSWKSVTLPWDEGGFDVREILSWNKALIAKQLWLLLLPTGGVWFQWIHRYCLSRCSIWELSVQDSHAQSLRSILSVCSNLVRIAGSPDLALHALRLCCAADKFSISRAYELFRPRATPLRWARGLKGPGLIPSHALITMVAAQSKLHMVDAINETGPSSLDEN